MWTEFSKSLTLRTVNTLNRVKGYTPQVQVGKILRREVRKDIKIFKYEEPLVNEIVDIVRNHEDILGKPKIADTNLNRIIVGEADRLFRITHINFYHLMKFHGATEEEVFSYFMEMKDSWYLTRSAQLIAEEEIRKIANSHLLPGLF